MLLGLLWALDQHRAALRRVAWPRHKVSLSRRDLCASPRSRRNFCHRCELPAAASVRLALEAAAAENYSGRVRVRARATRILRQPARAQRRALRSHHQRCAGKKSTFKCGSRPLAFHKSRSRNSR